MATLTLKKSTANLLDQPKSAATTPPPSRLKVPDTNSFNGRFAVMRYSSTGQSLRFTVLRDTYAEAEAEAKRLKSEANTQKDYFIVLVAGKV